MPIIANFPTGDSAYQRAAEAGFPGTEDEFYEQLAQANNLVTVLSGGNITMDETIGAGPYTIEFTEESDGSLTSDDIGAAKKDLTNVQSKSITANMIADNVLTQLGAFLAISAAAAYNPEGRYAVGDYCTHGGKLNKCSTPIEGGEEWNAAHWTETTVAAELAAVKTELDHKLVIYTSLESLGLTESNATIQSIIAAMADNTLLAASCGTDGYDAGWLPASYGFLRIQKITVYHTMLEYQIVYPNARIWRGYYNAASVGSEWSGWEMISIATPPQEHEISFRSGWSNAAKSTYYKTQEGSCVVNCAVYGTGVASDNFIATLPAGFRPSATVCRAAHAFKGGIRGIAEAQIAANGDIVIYSPIEFDYVSFGATFLAQN